MTQVHEDDTIKRIPQNEAKSSKIMLKINNLLMITLTRIVSLTIEGMDQTMQDTKQLPRKKKERKKRRRDQGIDGGKKIKKLIKFFWRIL